MNQSEKKNSCEGVGEKVEGEKNFCPFCKFIAMSMWYLAVQKKERKRRNR